MDGFDAVPGAADFLAGLGTMRRAIASSSRAEYIGWALDRFGLAHHFAEHVYSADGWERGKPHPDIYLAPAEGLGVDQNGRASCRERVCQYVSLSGVAVTLQQRQQDNIT